MLTIHIVLPISDVMGRKRKNSVFHAPDDRDDKYSKHNERDVFEQRPNKERLY